MPVQAFSRSGLTVREYCNQHYLKYWTFHGWRKKYRSMPVSNKASGMHFLEVAPVAIQSGAIEIGFSSGLTMRLPRGFDRREAVELIAALSQPAERC